VEYVAGRRCSYPDSFSYWSPGSITAVSPARVSRLGETQASITTTDLGAPISTVTVAGRPCTLIGGTTSTEASFFVPKADADCDAQVGVLAENGNMAVVGAASIAYYTPEIFGAVGTNVELSDGGATATRIAGVHRAVCLGALPLLPWRGAGAKAVSSGRYFEVRVEELCKSMRALAIGVAARPREAAGEVSRDLLAVSEARELPRTWLAGYDRGGAIFHSDGAESQIAPAKWRPAACLAIGTILGVLWAEDEASGPALVIFQDGVERLRLPATGRLPTAEDDLVAVIDLQGSCRRLSIVSGSTRPERPGGSPTQQLVDSEIVTCVSSMSHL